MTATGSTAAGLDDNVATASLVLPYYLVTRIPQPPRTMYFVIPANDFLPIGVLPNELNMAVYGFSDPQIPARAISYEGVTGKSAQWAITILSSLALSYIQGIPEAQRKCIKKPAVSKRLPPPRPIQAADSRPRRSNTQRIKQLILHPEMTSGKVTLADNDALRLWAKSDNDNWFYMLQCRPRKTTTTTTTTRRRMLRPLAILCSGKEAVGIRSKVGVTFVRAAHH
ncbi:hypothetical protein BJ875DRAFT_441430 [Amylocarpus encephaloides]|uniref:Uncharacterized protein n=1 Tax=Amylocarpus encephaloides TaxID=45428 RepID=A0A9P7YIU0_9HELO|nr:hypothetical protein BJ875DRAFT_441430 [Amylocarpus encephaloides]